MSKIESAELIARETLIPLSNSLDAQPELVNQCLEQLSAAHLFDTLSSEAPFAFERVTEALAYGSLSVCLIWLQHHVLTNALAHSQNDFLKNAWLTSLLEGKTLATVTFGGTLPKPILHARFQADVLTVNGEAPWVSGWDSSQLVYISALDECQNVIWFVVEKDSLKDSSIRQVELSALQGSSTVHLSIRDLHVSQKQIVNKISLENWRSKDMDSWRKNAYLSIGIARRCAEFTNNTKLNNRIAKLRNNVDESNINNIAQLRSDSITLALDSAALALAELGSEAVLQTHPVHRLYKEAAFLIIFGSRPAIRTLLIDKLSTSTP